MREQNSGAELTFAAQHIFSLEIVQDISGALTYLHNQDITHKEVKPENVLVSNGHYSG